jgi:ribonucleotide reductase alpha subunit/intein/homing endonuclease
MAIHKLTPEALKIWDERYAAYPGESFLDGCRRVAKHVAACEETETKRMIWEERYYHILSENLFIPGGRILRGAGRDKSYMLNCFVSENDIDSKEMWGKVLSDFVITSMCGGGVGVNVSDIRPFGAPIGGVGGICSGPLSFMRAINGIGQEIRAGGSRRCLPEGSLVHTANGLIPIEKVTPGTKVLVSDGTYHEVSAVLNQGKQQLIEINTQMGALRCTPNHRIAVIVDIYGNYEWKLAKDLQSGDRLRFVNETIPGTRTHLPPSTFEASAHAHTLNRINIPELTPKMAWLLGYIHGNGYIHQSIDGPGKRHGRVSVSCPFSRPDIKERIVEQLSLFGVTVKEKAHKRGGACWQLVAHSVELAEYFAQFKLPKRTIKIPTIILEGLADTRAGYLAGVLDSDGSISSRPITVASSIYPEFLTELQGICSSLGIASRIKKVRDAVGNWQALYHLDVCCGKQLGILKSLMKIFGFKNEFTVPEGAQQQSYSLPGSFANTAKVTRPWPAKQGMSIEYIDKVIGLRNYTPVNVLSINHLNGELEPTWDIEVADRHEFVVNGILVHNSALMLALSSEHPDIYSFINAKREDGVLSGANISVMLNNTTEFLSNVRKNGPHKLSYSGKEYTTIDAKMLFNDIISSAVVYGEPGILNMEYANRMNTLYYRENFSCCNPCSEILLTPNEACCLGHLVLPRFISESGDMDYDKLVDVIKVSTRFLDAVLDTTQMPLTEQRDKINNYRRIGLGITGLADTYIAMGYRYGSQSALWFTDSLMEFISNNAYRVSAKLAAEKGPFPAISKIAHANGQFVKSLSDHTQRYVAEYGVRNCGVLTVAPVGTGSLICNDVSSGIEPIFGPAWKRRINFTDSGGHERKREEVRYSRAFLDKLNTGADVRSEFVSVYELSMEDHLRTQTTVQVWVDGAIAKTINVPADKSPEGVAEVLIEYLPKLKGVTLYRAGSRDDAPIQPLTYDEALEQLGRGREVKTELGTTVSCSNGKCDL